MDIERTDKYIVLTPAEGKALTNGEVIADYQVFLPLRGDISDWWEIDKPSEEELAEASTEDYEQSLNRLGL